MFDNLRSVITHKKLWPLVDVFIFILITYGFHLLWWAVNEKVAATPAFISCAGWLADTVFAASAWMDAHLFRMDISLYAKNMIHFNANNTAFTVNESCSGFKQMWQVLVLFLFFPGPWKHKLWYIPSGLFAMFLVNIIRIVGLSFAMIYWPQHWDFIHMWILRPVYYLVLFILWVIWVERFGGIERYFKKS